VQPKDRSPKFLPVAISLNVGMRINAKVSAKKEQGVHLLVTEQAENLYRNSKTVAGRRWGVRILRIGGQRRINGERKPQHVRGGKP